MCGIFGLLGQNQISEKELNQAISLQHHRGPDDAGILQRQYFSIAHRRLSIIDLSRLAHQPMSNRKNNIHIVFNGEIYNHNELRKNLEKEGILFSSKSDTEVLLLSYEYYGIDFINDLIGMFAFTIIDERKQKAFLVRDRLGIKPLYYQHHKSSSFIFSSEIKSILCLNKEKPNLNRRAVASYLAFRQSIFDDTFFEGIESLPAGYYLEVPLRSPQEKKIVCYWDHAKKYEEQAEDKGEQFYIKKLQSLLSSSVSYRMISDVPVGSFLSGGVDSSIITALMAQKSNNPIRTYTIRYKEEEYNELTFSKMIAEKYATLHTEIDITLPNYLKDLNFLIEKKDSPLSVPNEIPLFKMATKLKNKVTVMLSGEGADEIFGGYGRIFRSPFDYNRLQNNIDLTPQDKALFLENYFSKYGNMHFSSEIDHFLYNYCYTKPEEIDLFINNNFYPTFRNDFKSKFSLLFSKLQNQQYENRMMYAFSKIHIIGLLQRVDSSTMAASVESRVPFLDHRLVEFAATIPLHYKLKWKSQKDQRLAQTLLSDHISEKYDTPKYLLKKAFEKELPHSVLYRKKMGFPVPLDKWLHGKNSHYLREILFDSKTKQRGIFNTEAIKNYLDKSSILTHPQALKLWMLMNLELFFRSYFDDSIYQKEIKNETFYTSSGNRL